MCAPAKWSKGVTRRIEAVQRVAIDVWRSELPNAAGVLNVQLFWDDATSTAKIIEINARYGGGFPLAREAGADFPMWMIEDQLGLTSSCQPDAWRADLLMLRYDAAVFVDAAAVRVSSERGRGRRVFDIDDTLYLERDYASSGFEAVDDWLREQKHVSGFADAAKRLFTDGRRGDIFDVALTTLGVANIAALVPQLVDVYRAQRRAFASSTTLV